MEDRHDPSAPRGHRASSEELQLAAPATSSALDADPGSIGSLLTSLGATFWSLDRNRRVTAVAGASLVSLGVRPEELIGRTPADVFRLPVDHPFLAAFDRALAGETVDIRNEWDHHWVHVRFAPLRDPAGEVIGCTGLSVPMPDDLEARPVTLNESGERLRRLIEASPVGIVHSHQDGRILEANESFLQMLGYTREDLAAGRIRWSERTPAEYQPRDLEAIHEAMTTGRSRSYEKEYWRKDGSRVPVLIALSSLPGRIYEGLASVLDLTPRKRVERRLLAQVQAASVLSRSESVADAAPELLRTVVETLGWHGGTLWLRDDEILRCVAVWAQPDPGTQAVAAASRNLETPLGVGLPGRVWATGAPLWIDDLATDPEDRRLAAARQAGLRCALGIPILSATELVGVIELGSGIPLACDDELLATLLSIARQLGLFVERERAEERRQRAESAGRQLLDRLQRHVERMPLAHVMSDESLRVVGWNPAAERIFGWRAAEVLGREAVADIVPPELQESVRGLFHQLQRRPDSVISQRNENTTRDGRRIVCDWVNTPFFDEQGRFTGAASMAQDVTTQVRMEETLRASEERYRSIVETTREGVWTSDSAGQTTFANPRLGDMLGCTPAELLGRSFLDFIPESDREQRRLDFAAILRGELLREDIQLQRVDGSTLWGRISAAPFADDASTPAGALVMVTDVTEQRALQSQLLQSQKMEALGRLAGGVAHDFNNVLTVIAGYAELLGNRFGAEDPDREFVDEIQKAADSAAALTRQLLAFSRHMVVDVQVIELNVRIRGSEGMLRRLLGEDIELRVQLQPDSGRVRADAAQIDQVLLNLVVNARDAMPRGGRLTIETADVDLDDRDVLTEPDLRPGSYVMLAVRDTGPGIEPDVIGRIFEPFFTTKGQGRGTGLGLSTVYGIVKQFGGHVLASSEPGLGAAFEVYLPRVDAAASRKRKDGAVPKEVGTETVLLVEDESAVRRFERRALAAAGYQILEAGNGAEAIALFETVAGRIDALVTDIVMPGMGGRELADELRARLPGLPVLYLSGYTDDAVLRHGVLTAEATFLQKPFSADALCARLRAVLDAAKHRPADED